MRKRIYDKLYIEGEKIMFNIKLQKRLLNEQAGSTAVEYGLICALIAVVSLAAVSNLGQKAESVYTQVNMAMSGNGSGTTVGGSGPVGGNGFSGGSRGGQSDGRSGNGGFTFNP
jgi:pilus assembly protein Flp/PilA